MLQNKKWFLFLGLLVLVAVAIAACQPAAEPETITVVETVVVEVEAEGEEPAPVEEEVGGEPGDVYRIALFADPLSLNYWAYLGPDSSVWTSYVLAGQDANLYTLSDVTFQFVPSLAKELVEPVEEGEFYTMTVEMVDDALWSDGEPITAEDVVFTQDACRELKLTSNWPQYCRGVVDVEALDDYTVKFTFNTFPSLGVWNAGVALAPILPQHFWQDAVDAAYVEIADVANPDVDCSQEELSEADLADCEAFDSARTTLYAAVGDGAPTAGGFAEEALELGAFAQRAANANSYFKDATYSYYEDGTWMLEQPNGRVLQLYGDAEGEPTLQFVEGPFTPNVVFSIYGSQDAAFLALANGEVDYVLNPLGLARGLREQAEQGEGIQTYVNADYGMYYLAHNLRKEPMSYQSFRTAVDIVTDKEFVVNSVLGGVVFPMYSAMPPGNVFWYNPDVPTPYVGMSREDRVNMAVEVMKEEGFTWTTEPAWNADTEDVDPGEGLRMPDGQPVPQLTILGPGPAYDPLRATFNQWISEWMRELGIPVESELTGFNTILNPVFVDANFDMYILGWSLGNVAFPQYFYDFWHCSQDTATTGNYNTPGYCDEEYDALIDEFQSTSDLDRAQELIYEAQIKLAEDLPYMTLFYKQVEDLARDNIVFPYTEALGGLEFQQGLHEESAVLFQ
jgi:ABC-type transport system substrate-binding protein